MERSKYQVSENIKILISASVPKAERNAEFRKIENAQIHIEEAVIAISRCIFHAGGQIIMGGHPSISPLIAMVSSEFSSKKADVFNKSDRSKSLKIYQSTAFEGFIADATFILYNSGFAEIKWSKAVKGEKYDPNIKERQCLASLEIMRMQMIEEDLDAMICVGGMEGVKEEFEMFRRLKKLKPVYLLKNTGGATYNLSMENRNVDSVKIYGDDLHENLSMNDNTGKNEKKRSPIFPFTLMAAKIINEISENKFMNI